MPEISRFYGIVIRMYYDEHNPPHFHAKYGDEEGVIQIDALQLVQGSLPRRALNLVWIGASCTAATCRQLGADAERASVQKD